MKCFCLKSSQDLKNRAAHPHQGSPGVPPLRPHRDVLSAWESISKHTARTKNEIENVILWNNHEVTIGGKSVFYKQLYEAGLKALPEILPLRQGRKVLDVYSIQREVQIN